MVVGGGAEHLPRALPDGQSENGSAKGGGCQTFGAERRISPQQLPNGLLAELCGHGYIGLHNSQSITSR